MRWSGPRASDRVGYRSLGRLRYARPSPRSKTRCRVGLPALHALPESPPAWSPSCGDMHFVMAVARPHKGQFSTRWHEFSSYTGCPHRDDGYQPDWAHDPRPVHRGIHNLWRVRHGESFCRWRLVGNNCGVTKIAVRLSADEIAVVCNCINEALDALADEVFETRVGADRQQARALLGRLSERRTAARRAAADGQ